MCGIFGYVGQLSRQLAQMCTDTLAHRGPDGVGLWHTPEVTFGHRRLSILDLSDNGKQPMSYADGRYHITFNGEIYNFIELRQELEKKGYRFISDSDTEVVIAAFIEWGEECLHRFNGMWAFAIWDAHEQALFLSRDRFGKKPLFYAHLAPQGFAFASEMKAIFPLLKEVRPNIPLVRDTWRIFRYEGTDECIIEGIKRFPAGHSGWLKKGHLEIRRWWCTLDHLRDVPARYEDQVEQFRELFLDACRIRMRSDVPLGTALSGGLDSSATISAMAYVARHGKTQRMGESWQHAFVASFPGTPLDETAYAKKVTDHLGIEATVIEIEPLQAIADLDRYLYLQEDLYITSPIPFMLTYGAVRAHGTKVTLDGHGADELFGGYPGDYIIALQDAGWNLKQAYEIASVYYNRVPPDSAEIANLPAKSRFIADYHARRMAGNMRRMAVDIRRKAGDILRRRQPQQPDIDTRPARWGTLDRLSRQLYVSTHETVLPTLLRNYDRYSMANGVEIRMPFLDHRIVSLAFSLPWTAKIRGGFSKAIVRDAMAPYMPHDVTYRKTKIGFNSPVVDWMKGPLKTFFLDAIASQSFKDSALIDPEEVARAVYDVIERKDAQFRDGERAWIMLSPYLWERAIFKHGKPFTH